jgi:hypothetical protein
MADFKWTDLIEPAAGLGGSIIGNKMQAGTAKASLAEQKRQFDIRNQQAMQARNFLMPVLQRSLGAKGPMPMAPSGPYGGPVAGAPAPAQGPGVISKVAPVAGMATGALSIPGVAAAAAHGLGALGGAIGAAGPFAPIAAGGVGAALLAKKFIGQGRKQANVLTGEGGAQNQFGAIMQEIAKRQDAGQLSDEQARAALSNALDQKAQEAMQFAGQGNNQRKVVKQWLGDFSNPAWMKDHPELAPIAQKYLGSLG